MVDRASDDAWRPRLLGVLRIAAGIAVLAHGAARGAGQVAAGISPGALTLPWAVGLVEVAGGALLVLGLFTGPMAFVLPSELATFYWASSPP